MGSINEDIIVSGRLTPTFFDYPAQSITNDAISATAGIKTTKMQHRFQANYSQPNTAATSETRTVFVARSSGTILELAAGSISVATGNATVTIDLLKNGVSVLTSVLTLDSSNISRQVKVGVLNGASVSLVSGDWLELVITATAGTGTLPTGVFASVKIDVEPS